MAQPTIAQCAYAACWMEAAAPKPGNVHPHAPFDDVTFADFAASALAVAPMFDDAQRHRRVGLTVLRAVQATRQAVGTNTNLGIVLLLAPLAHVPRNVALKTGAAEVLAGLTSGDTADVYQAIREAQPGGLGTSSEADVSGPPPASLLDAMRSAADRDLIARQYAVNFADVLDDAAPSILRGLSHGWDWKTAVVHTHLESMSVRPDTLIARKCGLELAQESARRAAAVLASGEPASLVYQAALTEFDHWLRADGRRRNPGSTADLIAAALFALLRDGLIADESEPLSPLEAVDDAQGPSRCPPSRFRP